MKFLWEKKRDFIVWSWDWIPMVPGVSLWSGWPSLLDSLLLLLYSPWSAGLTFCSLLELVYKWPPVTIQSRSPLQIDSLSGIWGWVDSCFVAQAGLDAWTSNPPASASQVDGLHHHTMLNFVFLYLLLEQGRGNAGEIISY